MKKKASLLVVVSLLLPACFSCNSKSSKPSELDSSLRNETNLDDSVYFGLYLYELDTIPGVKAYLDDTMNQRYVTSIFRGIHQLKDSIPGGFIEQIGWSIRFRQFILKSIKNKIRLSQKGAILIKGRRDGTLSQIILSIREDGEFDVHSTSWFSDELYEGTYKLKSDTLLLTFTTEKYEHLGDSLILKDEEILSINKSRTDYIDYYLVK